MHSLNYYKLRLVVMKCIMQIVNLLLLFHITCDVEQQQQPWLVALTQAQVSSEFVCLCNNYADYKYKL